MHIFRHLLRLNAIYYKLVNSSNIIKSINLSGKIINAFNLFAFKVILRAIKVVSVGAVITSYRNYVALVIIYIIAFNILNTK